MEENFGSEGELKRVGSGILLTYETDPNRLDENRVRRELIDEAGEEMAITPAPEHPPESVEYLSKMGRRGISKSGRDGEEGRRKDERGSKDLTSRHHTPRPRPSG